MEVAYQINTQELNNNFLESIKLIFGDKDLQILVKDNFDESSYLKKDEVLLKNIKDWKENKAKIVTKTLKDLGL